MKTASPSITLVTIQKSPQTPRVFLISFISVILLPLEFPIGNVSVHYEQWCSPIKGTEVSLGKTFTGLPIR